ncbi:hypothetical protein [Ligilactobacillus ruminis]|uniref:hypothetical protein n=1 Tax=Ligilactobacillus ruminis TaxID=1623 RepID=UPI003F9B9086
MKKGDSLKLKINGKKVRVKVSGVAEIYAGHFIYMTKAYYERATHDSYQSNVTIVRLKIKTSKTSKIPQRISSRFLTFITCSKIRL